MKKAFTLAEVLITLGIIGVVAALTAPSLTQNVQQQKIGPTLSKFVNVYENAMQQMMLKEEVSKVTALNGNKVYSNLGDGTTELGTITMGEPKGLGAFGDLLGNYMALDRADTNDTSTNSPFRSYNAGDGLQGAKLGSNNSAGQGKVGDIYVMKDGSIVMFDGATFGNSSTSTTGDYIYVSNVYLDINGVKKPNKAGRDVFAFGMTNDGRLIPYASSAYYRHLEKYGETVSSRETCDVSSTDVKKAFACTGAVADNNWKADY